MPVFEVFDKRSVPITTEPMVAPKSWARSLPRMMGASVRAGVLERGTFSPGMGVTVSGGAFKASAEPKGMLMRSLLTRSSSSGITPLR